MGCLNILIATGFKTPLVSTIVHIRTQVTEILVVTATKTFLRHSSEFQWNEGLLDADTASFLYTVDHFQDASLHQTW